MNYINLYIIYIIIIIFLFYYFFQKSQYETYSSNDYDVNKMYNAIKIIPTDDGERKFEISNFVINVIKTPSMKPNYDVAVLTKPEVILDENGLHWSQNNIGSTVCDFKSDNNEMQCTLEGAWSAFSFQKTTYELNGEEKPYALVVILSLE